MTYSQYEASQQRYLDLLAPIQRAVAEDLATVSPKDYAAWQWRVEILARLRAASLSLTDWDPQMVGLLELEIPAPNTTDIPAKSSPSAAPSSEESGLANRD